jgi:putative flippase GtrA
LLHFEPQGYCFGLHNSLYCLQFKCSFGGIISNNSSPEAQAQAIHPVGRLVRFGIVGGSGVLVNMGCYAIFHDLLGLFYQIARVLAIEVSIASNFALNERWTFRDRARGGWGTYLKRLLIFHIPSWLVAGFVQIWTHETLRRVLGVDAKSQPRWKDFLAYLVAIGLGALLNYFICNLVVFRGKAGE